MLHRNRRNSSLPSKELDAPFLETVEQHRTLTLLQAVGPWLTNDSQSCAHALLGGVRFMGTDPLLILALPHLQVQILLSFFGEVENSWIFEFEKKISASTKFPEQPRSTNFRGFDDQTQFERSKSLPESSRIPRIQKVPIPPFLAKTSLVQITLSILPLWVVSDTKTQVVMSTLT